jgi:hypothetical protein
MPKPTTQQVGNGVAIAFPLPALWRDKQQQCQVASFPALQRVYMDGGYDYHRDLNALMPMIGWVASAAHVLYSRSSRPDARSATA